MNRFLIVLAMSAAMIAPAFAEIKVKDMTCSTFSAMNQDEMMAAMNDAKMAGIAMASGDAMAMSPEDEMATLVKTCKKYPDMMVMVAMHPKK